MLILNPVLCCIRATHRQKKAAVGEDSRLRNESSKGIKIQFSILRHIHAGD